MSTCYDGCKSHISQDAMSAWLKGGLEKDLLTIPGVGPVAKQRLKAESIHTTHALLGLYLYLGHNQEGEKGSHNDEFYIYLKTILHQFQEKGGAGINIHSIVKSLSEKVDVLLPSSTTQLEEAVKAIDLTQEEGDG